MSSTVDTDDVVEVSGDGLTVRKRFEAEEFPVPTICFEIESDRDDPVSFRLTERIPPTFPMDGVGFHPDYHSDDWRAFQDNHLEFTGALDPGESLVTVYGVRLDDDADPKQFLTEPGIGEADVDRSADAEEVDDAMIGDIIASDRTQPVKDMLAGESDTVPGLDDAGDETEREADGDDAEDEDSADEIDLDLDLSDVDPEPEPVEDDGGEDVPDVDLGFGEDDVPDADSTDDDGPQIELDLDAAAASVDEDDGSEDDAADDGSSAVESDAVESADDEPDAVESDDDAVAPAAGSVAAHLADELREGDVDEDDRERIRSALGAGLAGSDVARIDHLQSRVEEVAAYTGAIEAFLDEEGTGAQLIEEFEDELASFDDQLSSFGSELSSFEDDLAAVDDRLDDVDADVAEVTDWVTDVDGDLRDVESDLHDVESDLEEVTETVTDIVEWRDQLGSMFTE